MRERMGEREGKSDEKKSERFGAMLSESVFCSRKRVDLSAGSWSRRTIQSILPVHFFPIIDLKFNFFYI